MADSTTRFILSMLFTHTTSGLPVISSVLGANTLSNDLTTFKPKLFCSLDNSQVEQTSLVQDIKLFFNRELLV